MKLEKTLNYNFEAYVMFRRYITGEARYAEDAHSIHNRIDAVYAQCEPSLLKAKGMYPNATEIVTLLGSKNSLFYFIPYNNYINTDLTDLAKAKQQLITTLEEVILEHFSEDIDPATSTQNIFALVNQVSLSYEEKWALVSMVESFDVIALEFQALTRDLGEELKPLLEVFEPEIDAIYHEWKLRIEENTYVDYIKDTFGIVWNHYDVVVRPTVMGNNSWVDVSYLGISMTEDFLKRFRLSEKNACKMLKDLGDPSKFAILKALVDGQKYGKELANILGLTPATISYHIQELLNDGLIQYNPSDNKRVYYDIAKDKIRELGDFVHQELNL